VSPAAGTHLLGHAFEELTMGIDEERPHRGDDLPVPSEHWLRMAAAEARERREALASRR
jgi:hypothetical protein